MFYRRQAGPRCTDLSRMFAPCLGLVGGTRERRRTSGPGGAGTADGARFLSTQSPLSVSLNTQTHTLAVRQFNSTVCSTAAAPAFTIPE